MPSDVDKEKDEKKKSKKSKLLHNQSPLSPVDGEEKNEIQLEEEIVHHCIPEDKTESEASNPLQTPELKSTIKCNCGNPNCTLNAVIGWHEESAEFEVIKRKYIIKKHQRQKYKGSVCGKIVVAPGPDKLAVGGEFSAQMGVEVAYDKFVNHMPLERQTKDMKNAGLLVTVKTLYGLTEHIYNHLLPIPNMIRSEILSQPWLGIDESPMKFFNPKVAKGYVWSISNNYGAFYQFEPTRSGAVARELLKGYHGNVISDAYKGYDWLDKKTDVVHIYCWNHVRSNFFTAKGNYPKAGDIVLLIDDLFGIEHEAKSFEELKELRLDKSKKKIEEIEAAIDALAGKHLESSSIGTAISYFNCRRPRLKLFIDDPYIPLSNNGSEQAQRDPVMGRNNFLYFRSINGADVGMLFYTLFGSCKRIGVNGKTYLLVQTIKAIRGEKLETPYQYGIRLREEISKGVTQELQTLKEQTPSSP
ncbi:MAG: IS66 family transposase [Oligoflexia bacterium]|nr:IS66 family transposase [Oligoflexia bacterium]